MKGRRRILLLVLFLFSLPCLGQESPTVSDLYYLASGDRELDSARIIRAIMDAPPPSAAELIDCAWTNDSLYIINLLDPKSNYSASDVGLRYAYQIDGTYTIEGVSAGSWTLDVARREVTWWGGGADAMGQTNFVTMSGDEMHWIWFVRGGVYIVLFRKRCD